MNIAESVTLQDVMDLIGDMNTVVVGDYLESRGFEITKLDIIPFELEYRRHAGDSTPAPPTAQPFWKESVNGAGTQTLTWPVENGVWSFVVMNGDGSAGVDVDMTLGAKVPFVLGVGVGLLVAGILVLLAGSTMVYFGARIQPGENDSPRMTS